MTTRLGARIVGATAALSFVTTLAVAARADEEAQYKRLVEEQARALVTVKYILKVKMGGFGDSESESEITGVMIDPKGLVLCSNTQLGGFTGLMRRFAGRMGGEVTATPTDIKVLIGDDTEGLAAKLLARDTELDLAWVQIQEPGDRRFDAIDPGKSAQPEVGQRLLSVRRMDKYFDRVAVVAEGRLGGITAKPRRLFVPAGNVAAALGVPVYVTTGEFVGVTVLQLPEAEDMSDNPMGMMGRMAGLQDAMTGLILPAEELVRATQRALEKPAAEETPSPDESKEEAKEPAQ